MTDPNTGALSALTFAANALIDVRDAEGGDKNLSDLMSQALTYIQAAMILACGRSSGEQQAAQQRMHAELQEIRNTWDQPNRG